MVIFKKNLFGTFYNINFRLYIYLKVHSNQYTNHHIQQSEKLILICCMSKKSYNILSSLLHGNRSCSCITIGWQLTVEPYNVVITRYIDPWIYLL